MDLIKFTNHQGNHCLFLAGKPGSSRHLTIFLHLLTWPDMIAQLAEAMSSCRVKSEGVKKLVKRLEEPGFLAMSFPCLRSLVDMRFLKELVRCLCLHSMCLCKHVHRVTWEDHHREEIRVYRNCDLAMCHNFFLLVYYTGCFMLSVFCCKVRLNKLVLPANMFFVSFFFQYCAHPLITTLAIYQEFVGTLERWSFLRGRSKYINNSSSIYFLPRLRYRLT